MSYLVIEKGSKSNNVSKLKDAIRQCVESLHREFEIHQDHWDHYLRGKKQDNGHIDWVRVPHVA